MHTTKTEAEMAHAIAVAAFRLHERLTATGGKWTERAQYRLLDLCNTVIALIDDGDCMIQRGILMEDLRCDEAGDPLGPEADLVPFALCQPLDRQIAKARREMGEAHWNKLNSEWSKTNA